MRAAIYIRVSSINESQDTSIENQEAMLRKEVESRNWTLSEENIYIERETGTSFSRNEMERLLEDAKLKKFDVVLTKSISRFGRNQRELLEAIEILDENDIRFIEFEKNIDTGKDRSLLGLYAWLAENESRQKSESIKLTIRKKQERGEFIGGRPPYGYIRDPQNKNKLIIAGDETTETVKRIYELYIQGYGYKAIAGILTDDKIPPPRADMYNRKSNDAWNFYTVRTILSSQYYIGNMEQYKKENIAFKKKRKKINRDDWIIVENTHEPIISKKDFYLVQEIMEKRSGTYRRKGSIHLFTGFLKCGECGSNLQYMKGTYICRLYTNAGVKYCSRHAIKETELEEIVKQDIKDLSQDKIKRRQLFEEAKKTLYHNNTDTKKLLDETVKEKKKIEKQLLSTYEDRLEGVISVEQYTLFSKNFDERKLVLDKKIKELEEISLRENAFQDNFKELMHEIDRISKFESIDRSILEKLIVNIIVHEIEGEKSVEIVYKF